MNEGYLEILNSISSSKPTPVEVLLRIGIGSWPFPFVLWFLDLLKSDKWIDGHSLANNIISKYEDNISKCITLANNDSSAFDGVMAAYRLPKDEEGSNARSIAIRKATIEAAVAPLETMQFSLEFMHTLSKLAKYCNANALTDLASASELGLSTCKMAEFNVRININHLSREDINSLQTISQNLLEECNQIFSEITQVYTNRLGW